MDGREAMALSGSPSFYMHRGITGSVSGPQTGIFHHTPPGFRPTSNPSGPVQSNVRVSSVGSAFSVDPSPPNFSHGINSMGPSSAVQPAEQPVKKKRGRPRKYGPDGPVSLGLSPMSTTPATGTITPAQKRNRGRPPGSGRRQQLAALGEWMSGSAGLAFTPHVITIAAGEDIATKIMSFSQQRPRAVCILSASGTVSAVTLRQPAASGSTVTYEGRFEILCLSGSYLVAEEGGPRNRTGGLSVSLSSADGHVIGGGVGGMLIASGPVQVVLCSFVYGGSKTKNKTGAPQKEKDDSTPDRVDKPDTAPSAPSQNQTPTPSMSIWPSNMRNPHTGIDLTRG